MRHIVWRLGLVLVLLVGSAVPARAQGTCATYKTYVTGDSFGATDVNGIQTTLGQTNMITTCVDSYSNGATQMNTTTDPNSAGSGSQATTLAGELERIRYVLAHVTGWTQWWTHYQDVNLADRGLRNHLVVSTDANTRSIFQGQMTWHSAGSVTRYHAFSIGVNDQGSHPESVLALFHVGGVMRAQIGRDGDLHAASLMARSHGVTTQPVIGHAGSSTGFWFPQGPRSADHVALSVRGIEIARLHGAGLVLAPHAAVMFRHATGALHVTGLSLGAGDVVQVGDPTRALVFHATSIFYGDSANALNTQGLTLNQGQNDNEILSLKSSDVAHGVTNASETDTFGFLRKVGANIGGLQIGGVTENASVTAIQLNAVGDTDTTKNSSASGIISLDAYENDGTAVPATPTVNSNLVVIRSTSTTKFIFDAEGTGHADDVWSDNAFDLAEERDVRGQAEPGTVLTYDTTRAARLTPTTAPGQLVAGVVSYHTAQLANGLTDLRQKYQVMATLPTYDNPQPVGLVGVLPVRVTNEGGAIQIGDTLVASSTPGHAMKATGPITHPKQIVCIAYQDFDGPQGVVLCDR